MATDKKDKYLELCNSLNKELKAVDFNSLSPADKEEYGNIKMVLVRLKSELIDFNIVADTNYLYGMGDHTLQEIADYTGVTRERVRQIEVSAIKKLKHPQVGIRLKDYLGI